MVSEGESGPMDDALFSVSLSAESPLQLTLTKTSLELLKALAKVTQNVFALTKFQPSLIPSSPHSPPIPSLLSLHQAYTKEYERKLEISADVQTLTGAPFTVVNKV